MNKEQELRRYQNELVIIGGGVIAFGLWSAVRTILTIFFGNDQILQEMGTVTNEFPEYRWVFYVLVFLVIFVIIGLFISIRLFIGSRARREGLGVKKSNLYLVLTVILIVVNIGSMGSVILGILDTEEDVLSEFVQILIDITNVVTLIQLLIAAKKSRQIEKELEQPA